MTLQLPPARTPVLAPDGGMDSRWYSMLVTALSSADASTGKIAGLGDAAKLDIATEAEVRAYKNVEKVVTTAAIRAAAAFVELEYGSPSTPIDWEAGAMRSLVMAGDSELATPTRPIPGTFMTIYVVGNDATEREMTYSSGFGGVLPATDDINNEKAYVLTVLCITESHFVITAVDGSPP